MDDHTWGMAPPALLQYWQVCLRWRQLILRIMLGALAIGVVATLLMPSQYTSTVRMEISRTQKNVTNVQSVESPDANNDLEFYKTQYALLTAYSLAERVYHDLGLDKDDSFFRAHGESPSDSSGLFSLGGPPSAADQERRERRAIKLLLKNITISPVKDSSLVDISYTSHSPALSARVANSWAQQFMEGTMDRRFASTAEARKFLEGRLVDLRAKLEDAERATVAYSASKGIVTLTGDEHDAATSQTPQTLAAADLEAINAELMKATADRVSAQSLLADEAESGATVLALNNPAIEQLREKRTEVAADYARTLSQFEPGYPLAKALHDQIDALDSGITREEQRVKRSRENEYREALTREQDLRKQVEALKADLFDQKRDMIQYNIYQREADTDRQLYDSLLQRYKDIGALGIGANNLSIVDEARVPDLRSSPILLLNLALALLAGVVVAGVVVAALEQIDEGVREPGQINQLLGIALLGDIPDVPPKEARIAPDETKSPVCEAYLNIRSNLAFSTANGVPDSMMVTSTRKGEGKSTTCRALATVIGRTGKRVLLIDADMRKPSLHPAVDCPNSAGLSNYLTGDKDWRANVQPTAWTGVSLLPAGPFPPSAAGLLSSDRMASLVRSALKHYDHVIVDSPPVLSITDAPLLSGAVQGCVFVIEAEGVALRGVKSALGRLQSAHAHILGAVLTKLKHRHSAPKP